MVATVLAIAYLSAGQGDTGIRLLEQAVAEYENMLGADNGATLKAQFTLGAAYVEGGRVYAGIQLMEDAIAGLTALFGSDDPAVVLLQADLDEARGSPAGG
jgi:hypothetical protein